MTFTTTESKVKKVHQGEDGFMLDDGMIRYPRAMLHVMPDCPYNHRQFIETAIQKGWLKCVAHIYKHEETFNILADKS